MTSNLRKRLLYSCALLSSVTTGAYDAGATILTFDGIIRDGRNEVKVLNKGYGDNVTRLHTGVGNYGLGNGFTPDITVDYHAIDASSINSDGSGVAQLHTPLGRDDPDPGRQRTALNRLYVYPGRYGGDDLPPYNPVLYADDFSSPEVGVMAEITLRADPDADEDIVVRLNSFDVGHWINADRRSDQPIYILDGDYNVLASYTSLAQDGWETFTSGIFGETLIIRAFTSQWAALDNINFDQIPGTGYCYDGGGTGSGGGAAVPEPASLSLLAVSLLEGKRLQRKQRHPRS